MVGGGDLLDISRHVLGVRFLRELTHRAEEDGDDDHMGDDGDDDDAWGMR